MFTGETAEGVKFRYSTDRHANSVANLFIEFFYEAVELALDNRRPCVYIISPWISNIDFTVYSDNGISIKPYVKLKDLRELLEWLSGTGTVKIVTRSYDDLLTPSKLHTYLSLKEELSRSSDPALIELYRLAEEELRRSLESIVFIENLIHKGLQVKFRPRLHSKMYVSPSSALLGSANLTFTGFKINEEFLVKISSENPLYKKIKEAATEYFEATTTLTREQCIRRTLRKLSVILKKYKITALYFDKIIDFLSKELCIYQ